MKNKIKYLLLAISILLAIATYWSSHADFYMLQTQKVYCSPLMQVLCDPSATEKVRVNVLDENRQAVVFALEVLLVLSLGGLAFLSAPRQSNKKSPR